MGLGGRKWAAEGRWLYKTPNDLPVKCRGTVAPRGYRLGAVEIAAWRRSAACRDQGLDLFFTPKPKAEAAAKAICAVCPVRLDCLWLAIDEGLRDGIFGGANQDERDRIARRLTPRKPTVVGRRLTVA